MAECEWEGCTYGGIYSAPHLKPRKFCLLHREEMVRIYIREKNANAQRNAIEQTRKIIHYGE